MRVQCWPSCTMANTAYQGLKLEVSADKRPLEVQVRVCIVNIIQFNRLCSITSLESNEEISGIGYLGCKVGYGAA